jgi:hypothetical protein
MRFRLALLALSAAALSACTTAGVPSNPLEARWNGKSAGAFFAAYGPPVSDTAGAGGTSTYIWRGGFSRGKSCLVELSVGKDYQIKRIKALSDRPGTNGGPLALRKDARRGLNISLAERCDIAPCPALLSPGTERLELLCFDRGADAGHQILIVAQIVPGNQHHAKNLV